MAPALSAVDPEALARALGLRSVTARLLVGRGVDTEEGARRFLEPRLAQLRGPESPGGTMAGFSRAADCLAESVVVGEPIGIFGDYDADGVTTTALLASFLRDAGGQVLAKVARRQAGYGFTVEMADFFADAGCRLLVTCDCGTSDDAALARARERAVAVIVVDHHQVPRLDGREPDWFALINPHQPTCSFPFKGLASVGVGFYLAAAVRTRLRAAGRDPPDPRHLLDLAALGTIADLVPLRDENRVLVSAGLRELGRGRRPGLRALLEGQGLLPPGRCADRPLSAVDVSFRVAPLLNAPGRLGDAQLALDLLLERDPVRAGELAAACQAINQQRRAIQDRVYADACTQVEAFPAAVAAEPTLVVAGDGWHHGVVGIVAAKLVERYGKPAVAIALDGEQGRGSARVPLHSPFHLYQGLLACARHLSRFGGHAAAAGLTVQRGAIDAFARDFAAEARRVGVRPGSMVVSPELEVDLAEIDEALIDELAQLGPFGMANPEPTLELRDVAVERTRIVGERHLLLTLRQGTEEREAIAFRQAERDPGAGVRVHASFVPEIDVYRGLRRLRLRVLAFEPRAAVIAPIAELLEAGA